MNWSLYIGKPLGIKVFIHWTFLVLLAWVLISQLYRGQALPDALVVVGFILAVFLCVTLHEYGHALTARQYGVNTQRITLLPIGGVASLEKIPERPLEELAVAVAGPLVNVVISLLLFGYLTLTHSMAEEPAGLFSVTRSSFLPALMQVNVVLVLFNLIPAFPMDGGRVLRALLAMRLDRAKATRIAAGIGQFFAIAFVFLGLFNQDPILVLVGVFIWLGAQAENQNVATESLLSGYKVSDVLMKDFTPLRPSDPLSKVVEIILNGQEDQFIVMSEKEEVLGALSKTELALGLKNSGPETLVSAVMLTDIASVTHDMEMDDAMEILQKQEVSIVPVYRNGTFAGVLDLENISEFILIQSAIKKD